MFLGKYKNLYDFLIDFARLVHFPLLPFSRFLLHCNLITISQAFVQPSVLICNRLMWILSIF